MVLPKLWSVWQYCRRKLLQEDTAPGMECLGNIIAEWANVEVAGWNEERSRARLEVSKQSILSPAGALTFEALDLSTAPVCHCAKDLT
jgi:hypothetical protein